MRFSEGGESTKPEFARRIGSVYEWSRAELRLLGGGETVTQGKHQAICLLLFMIPLASETIKEGATDQLGRQVKACSFLQVNFNMFSSD